MLFKKKKADSNIAEFMAAVLQTGSEEMEPLEFISAIKKLNAMVDKVMPNVKGFKELFENYEKMDMEHDTTMPHFHPSSENDPTEFTIKGKRGKRGWTFDMSLNAKPTADLFEALHDMSRVALEKLDEVD